jgi:hypothetical protein
MDYQHAFNTPHTLNWNGREVKFKFLVQRVKAEMVAWVKSRAISDLVLISGVVPGDVYDRKLDEFLADCRKGLYDFGSETYVAAAQSPDGVVKFVSLLTDLSVEDAFSLMLDMPKEVGAVLEEVVGALQGKVEKATASGQTSA